MCWSFYELSSKADSLEQKTILKELRKRKSKQKKFVREYKFRRLEVERRRGGEKEILEEFKTFKRV